MKKLIGCYGLDLERSTLEQTLNQILKDEDKAQCNLCSLAIENKQAAIGSALADNFSADGISVSLLGNPLWSDSALQRMQQEHGHAAALRQAYLSSGVKCLEAIRGPFAFMVYDQPNSQFFCAIDRVGIFGLYYHRDKQGGLSVASELSALRQFPRQQFSVDPQAIFHFLYFHMVPSPGTIYQDVYKLQPGQCLLASEQGVNISFYWTPRFEPDKRSSEAQLSASLREHLQTAVSRCNINQHSGAFLSGGLDSSTVVGMYAKISKRPRAFSIGFDSKGFDEIEFARASAKHFNSELIEYYVTPADVVDAVEKIAAYYEEPFGNASAIPTYYCAKLAKQHGIDNMLAGDGGDELFAGNARYAEQKVFELYYLLPAFMRKGLLEPTAKLVPFGNAIWPVRKLRAYIDQANIRLPHRLERYNFLEREGVENMLSAELLSSINRNAPHDELQHTYDRAEANDKLNRMLFLDWKFTLADNDLRKVSHMCHLAGVEVCYPMLDEDLLDFSCRVPPSLKLKGVKLRHFYKRALADFLPPHTISKSKHGFGLPFGQWLKKDPALQALAFDSLSKIESRGYFAPSFIQTLIKQHQDGHASYYGDMIWAVMMLEIWLSKHKL